jgi:enamine deaminase RidA (YjgF/YER057c/UK114 family)
MNKVYANYNPRHLRVRTAMGVNGLAPGARVENEGIAVLK